MRNRWLAMVVAATGLFVACSSTSSVSTEVLAEGLINPIGITVSDDGSLLVAEAGTGEDDTSSGVSLISNGRVDRVVSGLPSSRNSGDLAGASLIGVHPDGDMAYTAHFGSGALLTFPTPDRAMVDDGSLIGPEALTRTMVPLNRVTLVNPFDIAFDAAGDPVVTDASENGVATVNPDGTTRFIHRFGEIPAPGNETLRVEAVPTGIATVDGEFYVTLTGGCPYPPDVGRLVAVDGDGGERVVVDGLDMPIDVARGEDGTVWILEFGRFEEGASCFTGEGYVAGTGRLSRFDEDGLQTVVEGLDFPGAIAVGDGVIYVTEVFAGRVLRIDIGGAADEPVSVARPWRFTDVATDLGIDFRHHAFVTGVSRDPAAEMGGGLCWVDADGDGRLDLYLVNSHALSERDHWAERGGLPADALYLSRGERFEEGDIGAAPTARGMGCVAADFDSDGDTDIYVTADGPNALLINDGSGRFVDEAENRGVLGYGWTTAASVADVDADGDLDLFVGAYIDLTRTIENPSGAFPQDYLGLINHLYLNDGTGHFRDAAPEAGLLDEERTLGAIFTDVDGDLRPDLYVANDGQPNRLYLNERTAPFPGFRYVDVTAEAGVGDSGSGMGVASGDYDGDGGTDLFVTNWDRELHALYRSSGGPDFLYSTFRMGVAGFGRGETGWGTAWGDFDNDTDLDLMVVNGRVPITNLAEDAEGVRLMRNLTAEGREAEMRDWSGAAGLDLVGPLLGRGAAFADYDDDGDIDVAISQVGGPVVILRNDGVAGHWIGVAPRPASPGTTVTVFLENDQTLRREIHVGDSYLASSDPRAHFGLGTDGAVDRIEVQWPDGAHVELGDVEIDRYVEVAHP